MPGLIRRLLLCVLMLPFLLMAGEVDGPADAVLDEVARSVVKISAGNTDAVHKVGAGFVWPDKNHVVTALHVVDGPRAQVTVFYVDKARIVGSSPAIVERVLKESDLVLLRLQKPSDRNALRIDTRAIGDNAKLVALGFPYAAGGIAGAKLEHKYGPAVLGDLLSEDLKDLWKDDTYPSKKSEILYKSGQLVRGHSGGPVVDWQGRVVGVGDGGLEDGSASISWAIPAAQLERLLASNDARLPNDPVVPGLFTADQVDPSQRQATVETNEVQMVQNRTRTFASLAATADDKPALLGLAAGFQYFIPQSFRYDIYTDLPSGATLAVPAGLPLSANGRNLSVETGEERIQMLVEILRIRSDDDLLARVEAFAQKIAGREGIVMVPDPNWQRSGTIGEDIFLTRGALSGMVQGPAGFARMKCVYIVAAGHPKADTLLMAAAVDNECTDENVMMENSCEAGIVHPACADILRPRRLFVQLLLGVQFTTFSR